MSDTKVRCTAALQAIIDGDYPKPSSSPVDIQAAAAAAVAESSAAAGTASSTRSAAGKGRKGGGGTDGTTGTSSTSSSPDPADDDSSTNASLIPLTTHVLQRLLSLLRTVDASGSTGSTGSDDAATAASEKVSIAVAVVALAYTMVEVLLTDRPRLEKCAHAAAASAGGNNDGADGRSVAGRAVVTSSLATLAGLEVLVDLGPRLDDKSGCNSALLRSSTWSALRTLERLAHLNINPPSVVTPSGSGVQHSQVGYASPSVHYHATSASGATVRSWKGVMKQLCDGTGLDLLKDTDEEDMNGTIGTDKADDGVASGMAWACGVASLAITDAFPGEMDLLRAALAHRSTDTLSEPDCKIAATSVASGMSRRPTRKVGKKPPLSSPSGSVASSAATSLLSACHMNWVPFDGRISLRRWASMSLVWFGLGQKTLLELATQMLRTDSPELHNGTGVTDGKTKIRRRGSMDSGTVFWLLRAMR